jgi:hypothetical protein
VFRELIARVRSGDEDATVQLYRLFSHELVGAVLDMIPRRAEAYDPNVAARLQAEDVAQRVWDDVLADRAQLEGITDRTALWHILLKAVARVLGTAKDSPLSLRLRQLLKSNAVTLQELGHILAELKWPRGKKNEAQFELFIDPGDAATEDIQAVFEALSDLHRAAGGLGLEFKLDGTALVPAGEVLQ